MKCRSSGTEAHDEAALAPSSEPAGVQSDPVSAPFAVTVVSVKGDSIVVDGLHASDKLQTLRIKAAEALKVQRGVVKLLNGSQELGPDAFERALADLKILGGTVLTFVKQCAFDVREGMQIEVFGAGTSLVNGKFTCVKVEEVTGSSMIQKTIESGCIGPLCFVKEDGDACVISWYAGDDTCEIEGVRANGSWPPAWYMQDELDANGIYYLPSSQPGMLPFMDWESYKADTWALPGDVPMPQLDHVAQMPWHAVVRNDPVGAPFAVTVVSVTGDSMVVDGLYASDKLQTLRAKVAEALQVQRGVVKLLNGCEVLEPDIFERALADLQILDGAVLTLIKQRTFEVQEGMQIEVFGAGSARVNGKFSCVKVEEVPGADMIGDTIESGCIGRLCFVKRGVLGCVISWYAGDDKCRSEGVLARGTWPSAWYMQDQLDCNGIYYLPSEQPDLLSFMDWESYTAESWALPGPAPMPQLDHAAPG